MHLYLIRHGESYVNLKSWDLGNRDEGLTPLGQRQAARLADWLPGEIEQIDALYASTMKRAKETAAPIAAHYGLDIRLDDRVREVGNNQLDHQPWPDDDLPEYGSYWGSERQFDSITPEHSRGESLMHFRVRVGNFIESLIERHRDEVVVTVCHGGVIEFAFDHMFNVGPFRRCEVWSKNTGIAYFEFVEHPMRETWRLHYHSRVEHLSGLDQTDGRGPGNFDSREVARSE